MNKKTILLCVAAVAVLSAGVAIALFFLYSGDKEDNEQAFKTYVPDDLMLAIPADALAVSSFTSPVALSSTFADSASPLAFISEAGKDAFPVFFKRLASVFPKGGQTVFSIHYNSQPEALLAMEIGKSGKEETPGTSSMLRIADSLGLCAQFIDGQPLRDASSYIRKKSILLVSSSDLLVKSAVRHIERGISIYDCEAFSQAVAMSDEGNRIFFSNDGAYKLIRKVLLDKPSASARFIGKVAEWTVLKIDKCDNASLAISGKTVSGITGDDYWNVFRNVSPEVSQVADILPSYTVFALSIPMNNVTAQIEAYRDFLDSGNALKNYINKLDALKKEHGISPESWAKALNIKELVYAKFVLGDKLGDVLLIRPGKQRSEELTLRYYPGFASALFGKLFSIEDESCCDFVNGWMVIGPQKVVEEFSSGRAFENTVRSMMSDGGIQSSFGSAPVYMTAYFSVNERVGVDYSFRKDYAGALTSSLGESNYAPVVFSVCKTKHLSPVMTLTYDKVKIERTKAPIFERDTVVVVPEGPFNVINSATRKTNQFYQQKKNLFLCLKDENGKGLWGVKFDTPICGRAVNVDYYGNGKLQILFAAGSKLHLIDRIGRFVKPFPVELDSEVLIGPDLYDFEGDGNYTVMILHKDNSLKMYNLKGEKPQGWKDIVLKERIKGLPEFLEAGDARYWVVRTSLQTLVYPFEGGDPLTVYKGDKMIRPDSEVNVLENGSLEMIRYDGKKTVLKPNK